MSAPLRGVDVTLSTVSKRYEGGAEGTSITALDGITLTVPAGAMVAIMGPSGSGKSTLLHVVGAMDRPDEGRIMVGDVDVTSLSRDEQADFRRTIGFVFQRFHLLPALNLVENVAASVLPYKTEYDKFQRAEKLLELVSLEDRAAAFPSQLSGGQQQRVALARALISHPKLLLADEPTGNLDSRMGEEIMDLIVRLRVQHNMTVMIATHDARVASICDAVVSLRDGAIHDEQAALG